MFVIQKLFCNDANLGMFQSHMDPQAIGPFRLERAFSTRINLHIRIVLKFNMLLQITPEIVNKMIKN